MFWNQDTAKPPRVNIRKVSSHDFAEAIHDLGQSHDDRSVLVLDLMTHLAKSEGLYEGRPNNVRGRLREWLGQGLIEVMNEQPRNRTLGQDDIIRLKGPGLTWRSWDVRY